MPSELYREKSLERISSPENLNDYLKVTKPGVWIALVSVIVLLAGFLVWAHFTYIGSFVSGKAEVRDGHAVIIFDDGDKAVNVMTGMNVNVAGRSGVITGVGFDTDGNVIAKAEIAIEDGTYRATVNYKTTQVFDLLFDN